MEENEEIRCYFEQYDLVDPLQPRDAFFGGRTNAAKLFHQCEGEEKIRLEKVALSVFLCVFSEYVFSNTFLDMWILRAFIRGVTSQQEW